MPSLRQGADTIQPEGYMNTNTLLVIVILILLLGGGGFFWRGRR